MGQLALGMLGLVLRGELDQAALYGVLARMESLGLELVDFRRAV